VRGFLFGLILVGCAASPAGPPRPVYPEPPRQDLTEVLHGVVVSDPHRGLEDLDDPATRAWIEAENQVSAAYLEAVPARADIERRLTELWDYERIGLPVRRAGRIFFTRNPGIQDQGILYWSESEVEEARVLLDPNRLSPDGTIALTGWEVSEDGRLLAYALSEAGSDWKQWHVREVATGRDLADLVRWSKFSSVAWTQDGAGFFYSRYGAPAEGREHEDTNRNQKLYYHRLGTPQTDDELVYERPDQPEWGFRAEVSDDGATLVVSVWQGSRRENGLFTRDLRTPGAPVVELLPDFDARYRFVGSEGSVLYVETDLRAPLGRVVAIDLDRPARRHWVQVVPEKRDVLRAVSFVGGRLVAQYLRDAASRVSVYLGNGEFERQVELPGLGSVWGFEGRDDDADTFYRFTSFTTPGSVYRYDLATGSSRAFQVPQLAFDADAFVTRQVFATSPDGTRVPIFLVHRRDLDFEGGAPTFLYGYGGFSVSLTPGFSPSRILWLELGGVYAQANLRGGGEYGRAWHEAGRRLVKQNVFDDFLAAARWLVDDGVTTRERLAIGGSSNGGLLAAAALTQQPDLFGAVVVDVGVLDMLRFHRFTIGWAWTKEYGSPEDPEDFAALRAYSPVHNVRAGTSYPATLVTTADHDDRVFPAHSFKFAAALQAAQAGPAPILLRVETRAGHGAGKPTSKRIQHSADSWSFVVENLGVDASVLEATAE
jgi:prolyl oligopeptidase